MSLSGDTRATAIYNVVAAQPAFAHLNDAEKLAFLNQLKIIYGADTAYLVANTTVIPGTLAAPAGIPVATAGSPSAQTGSTVAPGALVGAGAIT